jgi:hypothetical protein
MDYLHLYYTEAGHCTMCGRAVPVNGDARPQHSNRCERRYPALAAVLNMRSLRGTFGGKGGLAWAARVNESMARVYTNEEYRRRFVWMAKVQRAILREREAKR